ncbi:MAG: lipocalin-like domain-containing protein [Bacteroidaceae bacterium]|nr:lipocalin-like domain-containing protein [Bacteroidaceae bacterium]
MKKTAIILMLAAILAACDKVYINGDLDGMWKLQQVEQGEESHHPTDIYYSFQRHMAQVSKHYDEKPPLRFIGHMTYRGDTITMSGFRKYLEEDKIATPDILKGFYLYNDSSVLKIEKLDDEMLIMRSNEARYVLRKW